MRMLTPHNMVLASAYIFPLKRPESNKCDQHHVLLDAERRKTYLDKRLAAFSTHSVSNKNMHAARGASYSQTHRGSEVFQCFLRARSFPSVDPNDTPVRRREVTDRGREGRKNIQDLNQLMLTLFHHEWVT